MLQTGLVGRDIIAVIRTQNDFIGICTEEFETAFTHLAVHNDTYAVRHFPEPFQKERNIPVDDPIFIIKAIYRLTVLSDHLLCHKLPAACSLLKNTGLPHKAHMTISPKQRPIQLYYTCMQQPFSFYVLSVTYDTFRYTP